MAKVAVSADRLRAVLAVEAGEVLALADLRGLLVAAGVHHGLRKESLLAAGVPYPDHRLLELAQGDPPQTGTAGPLAPVAAPPVAVRAGEVVAQRTPGAPGRPGTGVDGQPLPPPRPPTADLGQGLVEDDAGHVHALWDGRLVRGDDGVWRIDLADGVAPRAVAVPAVAVSADDGEASIVLEPAEYVEPEALLRALAANRVAMATVDRAAVRAARQPAPGQRRLVVARRTAPIDGEDARIEYCVDTGSPLAVDAHDRIDWHRAHWLVEVPAGAELVRLVPATSGTPGSTITGKPLAAKPGKPKDLAPLKGDGTKVRPEPPAIVSAIVGAYHKDAKGVVSVQCPVVVDGHLDLGTGDIDTTLPVVVRGDVLQGATLRSGATISVNGAIEDAAVGAAGDLVVGSGILAGKQKVVSHARIVARHVVGRRLRAAQILIENALMDAEAIAEVEIRAKAIIGGRALAGVRITCDQLGDLAETRTVVSLGIDASLTQLAQDAQQEMELAHGHEERLRERCDFLRHHLRDQLSAGEGLEEAAPLAEELHEAEDRLAVARDVIAHCERIIARRDTAHNAGSGAHRVLEARLVVRRAVHAGVSISFGDDFVMEIREQLGPSTFRIVDGTLVRE